MKSPYVPGMGPSGGPGPTGQPGATIGAYSVSPIYIMFYRETGNYNVLRDFFGPGLHVLMAANGHVYEFRERFGIIWIQMQASDDYASKAKPWKPIDKKRFFDFVNDPKQIALESTAILTPEQVLKMMSDPNNE